MTGVSTNNIGARPLTENELLNILPTYHELERQIESIRSTLKTERKDDDKKTAESVFSRSQVTNNISIIGARGSGKTSVIKSLHEKLKLDKEKNLILPGIVPENMPDNMTLMGSILGLLKKPMEEAAEKQQNSKQCKPEITVIEKKYHELVRYYGYQQERYSQVSVSTFSSESSYVDTNTNIFKAGNEFNELFGSFIDLLVEASKEDTKKLLFIFIDDIDLSTSRCTDVVKTLLTSISHPRIVTILSGDLDTFEEALTLDFIRQENLPDSDAMEKHYLHSQDESNTLLERKKSLAYEYLKKIMPPIYRHHIAVWSLEKRGEFFVESGENGTGKRTLMDLLIKIGEDNPLLKNGFQYEVKGKKKVIPQIFHLFDSTARGLTNVYHVLLNMVEAMRNLESNKQRDYDQIKTLLETILLSNPQLNAEREVILNQIILFGLDAPNTMIRIENISLPTDRIGSTEAKKIFLTFAFIDLALRLLGKEEILCSEEYEERKQYVLKMMACNPSISEKLGQATEKILKRYASIDIKKEQNWTYSIEYSMIFSFLRFDFYDALLFFQFNAACLSNESESSQSEVERMTMCLNFYHALIAIAGCDEKGIPLFGKYFEKHSYMFEYVQSTLSNDNSVSVIKLTFLDYFAISNNVIENLNKSPLFKAYSQYMIEHPNTQIEDNRLSDFGIESINKRFVDVVSKSIKYYNKVLYNYIRNTGLENLFHKNSLHIRPLSEFEKKEQILLDEFDVKRKKILFAIDDSHSWNNVLNVEICDYVIAKMVEYEDKIYRQAEDFSIDCKSFQTYFTRTFTGIHKGVSDTLARRCERAIYSLSHKEECGLYNLNEYSLLMLIVRRLAYSTAWYGVREANRMLTLLDEAMLSVKFGDNTNPYSMGDDFSHYEFWLHCFCRIQEAKRGEELISLLDGANNCLENIYTARADYNDRNIAAYKNRLEDYVEKDILDEIGTLFQLKREKTQ